MDIEILPALGWYWDHPWETNIIHTVKDWQILSFSAKWLGGEQQTHIDHRTDEHLLKKLWTLLDKAEIVVWHNGDRFDQRKISARFLYWGMTPPSPYRTIDTLKVVRKYFALLSNKQDDIGEFLKTGRKIEVNKKLWLDCIQGDKKALKLMSRYNAQDVILLEQNYLKLRPWIKNHPNLGMYSSGTRCPKCGSIELQSRGYAITMTSKFRKIWCKHCGGWSRSRLNEQEDKPIINL